MKQHETVARDLNEFLRRRAGRKRNVKVTLPSCDDLPVEDWAKRAKISLAIGADPLGITTGEYAERARYGVGEATPERMRHAKGGKRWLQTESERFKDGRPTGIQHKRFKSQLERWFERGTISRAAWLAAQAFQRDHDLSISAGGAMISKYGPTLPSGVRELLPAEIQVEYQKSKRAAVRAVDPMLRPILAWIADSSNDDISAEAVAADFWPGRPERTQMEYFRVLLDYVCAVLARHYEQKERHRWLGLSTSRAAQEINEMLTA